MKIRILAKVLGLITILIAVAMAICGILAQVDQYEIGRAAANGLYYSAAITFGFGLALYLIGWGKIERIPRREGVMIVGLTWIISGFFGSLPYILCEPGLSVSGAFFETVSGFTTTGSTVITSLKEWPHGILLWRSVTQWLGGLGILVLFVAILSSLGSGSKSLFRNESTFQSGEASTTRIRDTAQVLWRVYLILTTVCILGLKVLGMTWFDSVCHTMTAVSTGGFSPHDDSIAHFSSWKTAVFIELWLMLFMFICSMNFLVWVLIIRKRWDRLKNEEEGKWFFIIVCAAIVLITGSVTIASDGAHFWQNLREAAFTVVTIISTTGFGLADYDKWPLASLIIILALMLIGGCSGSTAGGMKVGRVLTAAKVIYQEVVHAFRPNQILRLKVNGNSLSNNARQQAVIFVTVFAFLMIFGPFAVSVLEMNSDIDALTAVGAVAATLGNIGPGFGQVGPTDNFAHFQPTTLFFLSLMMILGRLELFALLVLFIPSAWRRF